MPLYEFKCKSCGRQFEELVNNYSAKKVKCPKCKSGKMEKVISSFGFTSDSGRVSISGSSRCDTCTASSCENCEG